MLEAELDEVLDRSRYARRAKRSTGESEKHGHRHGHRSRRLLGTFGQLKIEVPPGWIHRTARQRSGRARRCGAYQRRTLAADAFIAGCYLAGTKLIACPGCGAAWTPDLIQDVDPGCTADPGPPNLRVYNDPGSAAQRDARRHAALRPGNAARLAPMGLDPGRP